MAIKTRPTVHCPALVLVLVGVHALAVRETVAGAGERLRTVRTLVRLVAGVLIDVELRSETQNGDKLH